MARPNTSSSTTRHGSDRIFRCHQDLIRLYSTSTRRSNSITSNSSSILPHNDQHLSLHDLAVLKQQFQFIRDDDDDAEKGQTDWRIRMSVRYYRQLFREYALADLSKYKEGKIGLRWRTEMEVVAGKGQFSCGNKHCDERADLHSYELLFGYMEHGERKRCLVKVRVCSNCAEKLFYRKLEEMRRKKELKMEKRERKRCRVENGGSDARREKRRRRSASYCDLDSCDETAEGLDDGDERKETRAGNDELDAESEKGIHELCAKINAEQIAAYPRDLNQPKNEFEELLP